MTDDHRITIASDGDVVVARQKGRGLAAELGFSATDQALIATAISELARNIVLYARRGDMKVGAVENGGRRGIEVVAHDDGPGIASVERALEAGFSTSGGLGLGLPGVRRLVDNLEIISAPGKGTTVRATIWRR